MANTREHPVETFSNPLKVAALLVQRGETMPFEKGARFNLVGGNGERHQFVHSAESLREARDTLQALAKVQGGVETASPTPQSIQDARAAEMIVRS